MPLKNERKREGRRMDALPHGGESEHTFPLGVKVVLPVGLFFVANFPDWSSFGSARFHLRTLHRPTDHSKFPLDENRSEVPKYVEQYVGKNRVGFEEGGWGESDVGEISDVSVSGFFEEGMVMLDN
ncbi:hypothetical protein AAHA92_15559 [Salvia divinorum]|uniref:Uncharacterized protein n=1 Tax=Salvia divinorum TaxID=28513 RepID=A0ABD1HF43_SALDI